MDITPTLAKREARKREGFTKELHERGWYHSFALPDGTRIEGVMPLEHQVERYKRFPIPDDLSGKRVLDIGAWDGWFSFEAERHGASVTAIDCVEIPHFLEIHRKLGSKVDYRVLDFYDLPSAGLGQFDIVFFLGVLYHLKHPFLALEIVSALTTGTALIGSYVTDMDSWREHQNDLPTMEFYERDELGGQFDNWIGPTVGAVMAMSRASGFARVDLASAAGPQILIAGYKRWEPPPAGELSAAPELLSVMNTRTSGRNFYTRREEYITIWFASAQTGLRREEVRFEIGGFGVPAIFLNAEEDSRWQANFRLPPGLQPGWNEARVRLANTDFSNSLRVPVDIPAATDGLAITVVCDGISWARNELNLASGGHLAFWVRGLGENCDRDNVRPMLGEQRLDIDYISEPDEQDCRQVNATAPAGIPDGEHAFRVAFGPVTSAPVSVRVFRDRSSGSRSPRQVQDC